MKIEWKKEYSVGVVEIDLQHKEWINITNRLDEVIESKNKQKLIQSLYDLASYAQVHFATEEKYFIKFGYSEINEHIAEHNNYREKIENFLEKLDKNSDEIGKEMIKFVHEWLIDHLVNTDRKYIECFKENKLS